MKTNLPVSQTERSFPEGRYLVSKTDVKGVITHANDAFVEISGFSRAELIGSSHNIVRHPDMPPQAFENLWRTIATGMPWRGVVKNRCKNGDFYWVNAFVAPVYQGAQLAGYISVRTKPSRAAIAEAEGVYQRLRSGKAKLSSKRPLWARLSIKIRLLSLIGTLAMMVLVGSLIGVGGIEAANSALERVYRKGLEPVEMISQVTRLMSENRTQVLLALQHSPGNPFSVKHTHPLATHVDAIAKNRDQITALVGAIRSKDLGAELLEQLGRCAQAREAFVKDGLTPAIEAIQAGEFDRANGLVVDKIDPAYAAVEKAANDFRDAVMAAADRDFSAAGERYVLIRNSAIAAVLAGLAFVALTGFVAIRSITRPVQDAIRCFAQIAQGDLTGDIALGQGDELGVLMANLAIMQANLKAMLDEIKATAEHIDVDSVQITAHVAAVCEQSHLQRDNSVNVASATEQFSASVHEVAEAARSAAGAASDSQEKVAAARESMNTSVDTTNKVVSSVRQSSRQISDLEQVISKIGTVTGTIREIAEQTNLLALNAAIEAARAGDDGRGFAVVATEVRKLAERTSKSTSEITAMVSEIHQVTEGSVASINQVVSEVEQNAQQILERITDLETIREASHRIREMSTHIADAAQEQVVASEQVAQNMEQIAGLIEGNMGHVHRAKTAADSITRRAGQLRELCAGFKV